MSIIESFNGSKVVDEKGHSLGAITDVVYDGAGNSPTWLSNSPTRSRRAFFSGTIL